VLQVSPGQIAKREKVNREHRSRRAVPKLRRKKIGEHESKIITRGVLGVRSAGQVENADVGKTTKKKKGNWKKRDFYLKNKKKATNGEKDRVGYYKTSTSAKGSAGHPQLGTKARTFDWRRREEDSRSCKETGGAAKEKKLRPAKEGAHRSKKKTVLSGRPEQLTKSMRGEGRKYKEGSPGKAEKLRIAKEKAKRGDPLGK